MIEVDHKKTYEYFLKWKASTTLVEGLGRAIESANSFNFCFTEYQMAETTGIAIWS